MHKVDGRKEGYTLGMIITENGSQSPATEVHMDSNKASTPIQEDINKELHKNGITREILKELIRKWVDSYEQNNRNKDKTNTYNQFSQIDIHSDPKPQLRKATLTLLNILLADCDYNLESDEELVHDRIRLLVDVYNSGMFKDVPGDE